MSSKTGASGSYLSTPMDVLPLSRRRFYPSGYGDRVVNFWLIQALTDPSTFPFPTLRQKELKSWLENGQRWRTIQSKKVHETSHSARLLVPDSLLLPQRESKQRRPIPRKPINLLTPHEGRSQVAPYSQIRLIATFFCLFSEISVIIQFFSGASSSCWFYESHVKIGFLIVYCLHELD